MDLINGIISFVEKYWSVALFGTVSIGGVVTTAILLIRQYLGNTKLGASFLGGLSSVEEKFTKLENLFLAEKKKNEEKDIQLEIQQQIQTVMFDGLSKLILSSKLDPDDKINFVQKVGKVQELSAKEIVENTTETVTTIAENIAEDPGKFATDLVKETATLFDKYNVKGE